MEAAGGAAAAAPLEQQPPPPKADRLNSALQQQLNLDSVKARADGLYKAVSRILQDFDLFARNNATPKWQDVLGQYSMVNMELYSITEEIKKVSKAFVVHPKTVNAENATILPVMLSSKLLPEMEAEDNAKREQLLFGITNLPITTQIEKLKARIDMIGTACETAEKIIADARKNYGLGSRQGPNLLPSLDKVQAAKILEQENLLRAAVNSGEGLRIPADQRHLPSTLPSHLVDLLAFSDGAQTFSDASGAFPKNAPSFSSNNVNTQVPGVQAPGGQLMGRPVPSPSAVSGVTSFENAATPPLPYANSPRSSTNIMNTPSPQQQTQQQQQRQKMMQIPQHQQQLIGQQQLRQTSTAGVMGQNALSQLHDFQGQAQQKFQPMPGAHQMQFSQPLAPQQYQNRQLQSAHMQHNIAQSQMNQGNQLRNHHLGQFSGSANSALFNAAQTSPNPQMINNMSATMQSQSVSRQYMSGAHTQRTHPSQILNDQIYGMGASNPASMAAMQQQQQQHGGYGNMQMNPQNLQQGMGSLPNTTTNPNFQQQRQQNQQ